MIRIRKILAQEWDCLLAQLGAPDARTLFRRALFWVWFYAGTGSVLGGLVAVYELFGMAAFWVAVAGVYLFCIWLIARTGGGGGADPEMYTWMGVTPPGRQPLPPSGTPQIGRASTGIARRSSNIPPTVSGRQGNNSRPGPVARR